MADYNPIVLTMSFVAFILSIIFLFLGYADVITIEYPLFYVIVGGVSLFLITMIFYVNYKMEKDRKKRK